MTNRGAIVAAFVAGAMLVAVAVVAYGAAPTAEMSLAEKKAALAALSHQTMQKLDTVNFGADSFGTTGEETGNEGAEWNVGATGHNHAIFGKWGIDVPMLQPELIHRGGWSHCSSSKPCPACHGDCDGDSDCAGHLTCFQRSGNDAGPSGCSQSGLVDGSDYCYDPGSLSATQTSRQPLGGPSSV